MNPLSHTETSIAKRERLPLPDDWSAWVKNKIGLQITSIQAQALTSLASGRDTMLFSPTGSGKSLVYFAWATYVWEEIRMPSLILSPLIALMEDQLNPAKQWLNKARILHSHLDDLEQYTLWADFIQNKIPLLYCSPEKIIGFLNSHPFSQCKIATLIIDEAHCLSTWGHEFRPAYRQLHQLRQQAKEHFPIFVTTASATPGIRHDLTTSLQLIQPAIVEQSVFRDNLAIDVNYCPSWATRLEQMLEQLYRLLQTHSAKEKFIIYCSSRKKCVEVFEFLKRHHIFSVYYHAGISAHQRKKSQQTFQKDHCAVMIATCAFGLGINIPHIRCIFHLQMPSNMTAYYQEIGRAGRDHQFSHCTLWYSKKDYQLWRHRLKTQTKQVKRCQSYTQQLDEIWDYVQNSQCRMQYLCQIFSPTFPHLEKCMKCDNCQNPKKLQLSNHQPDQTMVQQEILCFTLEEKQFIVNLFQTLVKPISLANIVLILKGSQSKAIISYRQKKYPQWGVFKSLPQSFIRSGIMQMVAKKELVWKGCKYPTLWLANRPVRAKQSKYKMSAKKITPSDRLLKALLQWRKQEAKQRNWKIYMICHRVSLQEIANTFPSNHWELAQITGIGPMKLERFAERILCIVQEHIPTLNQSQ